MAGSKPAVSLEAQYELNLELSQQLGLVDPQTFPQFDDIASRVGSLMRGENLLVIAPSVTTIPFRSCKRGDKSLVSAFSTTKEIDVNGNAVRIGAQIQGGEHFAKTKVKEPIHDRGITAPYVVAVVPDGLSESGWIGLKHTASTTEEQRAVVTKKGKKGESEAIVRNQFITAGQYLAANALRRILGKEYMRGHTRCPFYGLKRKGTGTRYVPTLSSHEPRGVIIQEFDADTRQAHTGVRLVHDIVLA